jgi:threonine dehydrogenase-like Zn-dependent dehydrogenase
MKAVGYAAARRYSIKDIPTPRAGPKNVHCGRCDDCPAGPPILCPGPQGYGSDFPGFFAERVTDQP